jgi:O-antigen/teichoic acid export membrane protein
MLRQGLAMLVAFASSILFARVLGPERKGAFNVALLIPTTAITLFNLGIGYSTVFHVARGATSHTSALRNNIKLALVIGLASMALASLVIWRGAAVLFPGIGLRELYASLMYIPFGLLAAYSIAVVQGLQDFPSFNLIALATQVSAFLLSVLFVWVLDLGVTAAIGALTGGQLLGFVTAAWVLNRRTTGRSDEGLASYARRVLPYGLSANVNTISEFAVRHVDQFLVNLFLGPTHAGIYILAGGLAERLAIMSSSPSAVMLPRISELEGSNEIRQQLTPIVARHVLWSVVIISLAASLLASALVTFLYGEAFSSAAEVFRLLIPGTIMLSLARVLASDIAGRGRPGVNARISLSGVVLTVALDAVLIPRAGIRGAAVAFSIASAVSALLTIGYYCRAARVSWTSVVLLRRTDLERLGRVAQTQIGKRLRRPKPDLSPGDKSEPE